MAPLSFGQTSLKEITPKSGTAATYKVTETAEVTEIKKLICQLFPASIPLAALSSLRPL